MTKESGSFEPREDRATTQAPAPTPRTDAALEACKWLVAYHEGSADIVTFEEYLSRAREAIAKVSGGCPPQPQAK